MENIKISEENVISNIIAIINYNKNNYCIYKEKDNVNYGILNANKFEIVNDDENIEILNKFYDLIRFNKEYGIFCGDYKLNQNKFEIYQDLRSKLYTFVLIKDNKKYIPSKEDAIILNSYFNNEQFIFYNEERAEKNNNGSVKFIKKVLKIGGISALVLISATTLTYNLPQYTKNDIDYTVGSIIREDLTQKDKSFNFEQLEEAIDNNENIPEKDKLFIKDVLKNEFEENKEYMDISKIIERLKTLKIQYDKHYTYNEKTEEYDFTHGDDISANVGAYYNVLTNKMTLLESSYSKLQIEEKKNEHFGFDEVDKSTYYHELNHAFTIYDIDSALSQVSEKMDFLEFNDYMRTNTGIFEALSDDIQENCNTKIFRETINEIFTQEYVDKYYQQTQDEKRNTGYFDDLPYMYCLAEILPIEVLREYKFNDNDSIITEGLLNISSNKSEAYKFMTSLKSMGLYSSLIFRAETNNNIEKAIEKGDFSFFTNEDKEDTEEVKQAKQEEAENYRRIHDGFAYFYKAKYNKEMSNDMNVLIYLYNTPVLTDEERQKVAEYLDLSTENPKIVFQAKGYFSKDYIKSHPYVTVKYKDKNSNDRNISIDANNRYIENSQNTER